MVKRLTLPDWFSIYRMVAAPVIILVLFINERGWFIGLILVSLASDIIDGFLARKLKEQTRRGSIFDSVGDVITLVLMIAGLFRFHQKFLEDQKIPLIILTLLYLFQLFFALLKYHKPTSFHTYSSKIAFIIVGVFYILLFIYGYINWLFTLSMIIMFLAVMEDILITIMLPSADQNVKGTYWLWKQKRISFF